MKIKSIRIRNYKSLKDIQIDNLGNLAAFIGPNMAGKSNFFDAINFLRDGAQKDLKDAIAIKGSYADVVWRKNTDMRIEYDIIIDIDDELRKVLLAPFSEKEKESYNERLYSSQFLKQLFYTLVFKLNDINQSYEEKLELACVDKVDTKVMVIYKRLNPEKGMYNTGINTIQEQLRQVVRGGDFGNNIQNMSESPRDSIKLLFAHDGKYRPALLEHKIIAEFIKYTKQWYWLGPHIRIQDHVSSSPTTSLDPEAQNLAGVIHTLSSTYPDKLDNILQELQGIIGSIERLSSPISESTTTIGMRESGQSIATIYNLSNFSAGFKNVLAMTTLLNTVEDDALIMVEEPENHLHPKAIRQLVNLFQKHLPRKQILLTTHSATVLLNFSVDNIYLAQRDQENNTRTEQVSFDTISAVIDTLGIRPSDFLDHNLIIFVEGDFDVEIYNAFAKKHGLDSLGSIYISTDGWKKMDYHANASVLEKRNVCPKIIAIFDGDTERNKHEKNRMLHRMRVLEENIITLTKKEIECYLLDAKAWLGAFPQLKITEKELNLKFKQIEESEKPRKQIDQAMVELGVGSYTREKAVLIVEKMETIPGEIKQILERIQVLKDN